MDFSLPSDLFTRANTLLVGSIYTELSHDLDETFLHISSIFDDEWYNFMVPLVTPEKFNWRAAEVTIEEEAHKGKTLSYYIHSTLKPQYESELSKRGYSETGSEVYMSKQLTEPYHVESGTCQIVNANRLEEYLRMSVTYFPDWDNSEEYSRACYEFEQTVKDREFPAFLLEVDGKAVAAGAMIFSPNLSLGYIHNTGTLPEYRRKGYFASLLKHMCNYVYERGVSEVYAIVEEDSASFKGFAKLGFNPVERFYLYGKVK